MSRQRKRHRTEQIDAYTAMPPLEGTGHPDRYLDPFTDHGGRWGPDARAVRRSLWIRRGLALAIIVAFVSALYYVIFHSPLVDPLTARFDTLQRGIDWVIEEPSRAWAALAVFLIPHIGLYCLIFEDR